MNLVETYGGFIKKTAPEHPNAAYKMIKIGLEYEKFRTKHLADKRLPGAYRFLNTYAVEEILNGLKYPENTVWANIFTPVEILQCFGVNILSIEALSSFLSGFTIEDYFLDYAENEGIASTLCSYHKNYVGAVDSGVVKPAKFAVTTSTICDGNYQTFKHFNRKLGIPTYFLDIPDHDTPESEEYVISQLKEFIAELEIAFGKKMDYEELKRVLERENEAKACYERLFPLLKTKAYPSTLTIQLYMLFANHLYIGSPNILKFYQMMEEEVKAAPEFHGTNIYWVHLMPYYQKTLQSYFNLTRDYQIQGIEMSFDYRPVLDTTDPLRALAKKLINNIYTGSYERKANLVVDLVKTVEPDGVINFCHWGCKQSAGGVMILKEKLNEIGVPLLILDGDGMDRRNSHDGQIKTRLEAFLEMIKQKEE